MPLLLAVIQSRKFLFSDYDLRDTEYRYCFQHCLVSLIGGCEEDVELFDKMHEQISNFETPSSDEIHTLEEFADAFHEFIHRQFREITLIAGVHNVEQAIDA